MYRIFTTLFFIITTLQSNFLLSQNYLYKKPSRDGIGKIYQGREISRIMGHFGSLRVNTIRFPRLETDPRL